MKKLTQEEFIAKAKLIHGDKYDYNKTIYINSRTKLTIICPIHGEFLQEANSHIQGKGCDFCGVISMANFSRKSKEEFITKAKIIHEDRYDYSLVQYINGRTKVKIICPKHGEFSQRPIDHIGLKNGCPNCKTSKSENKIRSFLENYNIKFTPQHTFNDCRGKKNKLPFDFYLPDYNTCIEYDGEQHFKIIPGWGHQKLETIQYNDSIKSTYCQSNNINLIRIKFDMDIEKVLKRNFVQKIEANLGLDKI